MHAVHILHRPVLSYTFAASLLCHAEQFGEDWSSDDKEMLSRVIVYSLAGTHASSAATS